MSLRFSLSCPAPPVVDTALNGDGISSPVSQRRYRELFTLHHRRRAFRSVHYWRLSSNSSLASPAHMLYGTMFIEKYLTVAGANQLDLCCTFVT